jgi:hypothetical protein
MGGVYYQMVPGLSGLTLPPVACRSTPALTGCRGQPLHTNRKFQKGGEVFQMAIKAEVYEEERMKLREIFKDVDPDKARLVEGLIMDAATLYAENSSLRESIAKTGMVLAHPQYPALRKATEEAKQYLKNLNSYAVVIKTLSGILQKNIIDQDDDFDDFMRSRDNR